MKIIRSIPLSLIVLAAAQSAFPVLGSDDNDDGKNANKAGRNDNAARSVLHDGVVSDRKR